MRTRRESQGSPSGILAAIPAVPLRILVITERLAWDWQLSALQTLAQDKAITIVGVLLRQSEDIDALSRFGLSYSRRRRLVSRVFGVGRLVDVRERLPDVEVRSPAEGASWGPEGIDLTIVFATPSAVSEGPPSRLGTLHLSVNGLCESDVLARSVLLDQLPVSIRVVLTGVNGLVELGCARSGPGGSTLPSGRLALLGARAAALVVRAVQRLANEGVPSGSREASVRPIEPRAMSGGGVSASDAVVSMFRATQKSLAYRIQDRFVLQDYWVLAYRTDPTTFASGERALQLDGFRAVVPPGGSFYADPCVFEYRGKRHIFFEEYLYAEKRGVISQIEILPDGSSSCPKRVLERPYHLSYPFVFAWADHVYMVPETYTRHAIELYRAKRFPNEWEYVGPLLRDVGAVDSTLYYSAGRWWIFTCVAESASCLNEELFIYYADTPLGPWLPHPMNPVKSDVTSVRPAGGLFSRQGQVIRPAQDCSATYGGAITLCAITKWSEREYEERSIARLAPSAGMRCNGLHTLSTGSSLEAIDLRVRVRRGASQSEIEEYCVRSGELGVYAHEAQWTTGQSYREAASELRGVAPR